MINPDGSEGFQVNCGIRIAGGGGRNPIHKKHGLRALFKGIYGPTKLKYKLFPDTDVDEFDTIVFKSCMNISWNDYDPFLRTHALFNRDRWCQDTQRDMGAISTHGRFVHLYLDGLYWGIYDMLERPDASFMAHYLGGEKENYDAINQSEIIDGDMVSWNATINMANSGGSRGYDNSWYEDMQQWVDIDNICDHILNQFYNGNIDWTGSHGNNWRIASQRIYDEGGNYEGFHTIGGDIVAEVHPIGVGKMIAAFCNNSSISNQASCYTHTFIPQHTDFDDLCAVVPMTIEIYRSDGGSAGIYYDCAGNELTIEFAHNTLTKATLAVVGGKFTRVEATTPSYPAGSAFPWNVTSVSLGGVAADEIKTLTIKGMNALEAVGTLDGTKTANRIKRNGFRTFEISGTLMFDNQTEFTKYINFTNQRLIVNAAGATIGNSTVGLNIDIPKLVYTAFPPNIGGPGLIEVSFTAKATYDTTSSYIAEYTLVNTKLNEYLG